MNFFSFEVYQTVIEQMPNQIVHLALSPSLMTKRVEWNCNIIFRNTVN